MSAADLHTLTGAYALDAVTGLERAEFDRHLRECPVCADEVREFRETAGLLAVAAADSASSGFRERILAAVAVTRQLPPQVDFAPATRTRPVWHKRAGIAVAAVAAAVGLLVGGISIGTSATGPVPAQVAVPIDVSNAPDATTVHADGASGAAASATLSRRSGLVTVDIRRLPALTAGQAYQFWLMGPRGARSAGLLHASDGSLTTALARDADRIGVTVEPSGGSPQPTAAPILLIGLV
ncbi:anti-sigma factor domain-containing protein [Amycolatopsis sp. cg13]|uniref:anti-sigma factor n=1 Tax=Amycolatopsis sp. cg13 TaxID=3238807 RepID=UPI0035249AB7